MSLSFCDQQLLAALEKVRDFFTESADMLTRSEEWTAWFGEERMCLLLAPRSHPLGWPVGYSVGTLPPSHELRTLCML